MTFFRKLWDQVEHDAKPLLSASAHFAESEGLVIVKEVGKQMAAAGEAGLVVLFNQYVGPQIGVTLPANTVLTAVASDLLGTSMARAKAASALGTQLRVSVLNAGIEEALLLAKGAAGDTRTAPLAG